MFEHALHCQWPESHVTTRNWRPLSEQSSYIPIGQKQSNSLELKGKTRNAFRFCFFWWDKKLTEIEKLYKTTDVKLFFLIHSIKKLQLNSDTNKKQNPVKKLQEVCRPWITGFSFGIFLISQNVNQLTTASFPSSGLFCDDVCSYSVEVLWGHVLTAEVKNIKGFGHLKRTAVKRR